MSMKRLILYISLLLVLFVVNAFGQDGNKCLFFGIHAGLNYSNIIGAGIVENSWINGYPPDCYTNSSASNDFTMGISFGAGMRKQFNKTYSLGFDLNYEEKGCKIPLTHLSYPLYENGIYTVIEQEISAKSNIKLKYLQVPVKIEKRFRKIYIQSGIYGGILMDADDYGKILGIYFERDKDSRYALLDVGVLVGFGIMLPVTTTDDIKIGLNGNWNLSGNDGRSMTPGYEHHWYNQCFNLEIRYEKKI